jgi:hypothetical protein
LGHGDVSFHGANVSQRDVDFTESKFVAGDVKFLFARGSGRFFCLATKLGEYRYNFEDIKFGDQVAFRFLKNTQAVEALSFRDSAFEDSFDLSAVKPFNCVVDLVDTRMAHQVSLGTVVTRYIVYNTVFQQ